MKDARIVILDDAILTFREQLNVRRANRTELIGVKFLMSPQNHQRHNRQGNQHR